MLDNLTDNEKIVMNMLIQGYNYKTILEWLGIDYSYYNLIRKSILKKLSITRITQLTKIAIKNDYLP